MPHAIDALIISLAEFIGPKVILPVSADVETPIFRLEIPIANLFWELEIYPSFWDTENLNTDTLLSLNSICILSLNTFMSGDICSNNMPSLDISICPTEGALTPNS